MIHNPYWDEAKEHARPSDGSFVPKGALEIGGLSGIRKGEIGDYVASFEFRRLSVRRYAFTVTDPASVDFVAEHSKGQLVDPIAGTGYWCYLLMQVGVDCLASDLAPPRKGARENQFHPDTASFITMRTLNAVDAVTEGGADRTLLLSWPPYATPLAHEVLNAYRGDRLIFIGEGDGGCTGDEDFFALLEKEWNLQKTHLPVQFWGIHDYIFVYDRRKQITSDE